MAMRRSGYDKEAYERWVAASRIRNRRFWINEFKAEGYRIVKLAPDTAAGHVFGGPTLYAIKEEL